ncbi:hypothetical protein EHQ97_11690 [Leptospira adleri]|nr:hypothetical protein [Leptospira adleri]TGM56585.1 hypothetical protein EHQ97_11690 [Leptospira adleri]
MDEREVRRVKIFKSIFYFLLLLIVCEAVALGAVAWSFLESSLASFELLKIGSDNRARDTLGTLAKAAENSGADRNYEDINFVFNRMTKLSEKDSDGYTIKELFLTTESGIVLAHSNPEYLQEDLKKRKPVALYQDALYTRAFRLRKWQIGIPVLMGEKKEVVAKSGFFSKLAGYFPEINEPEILLSAAVFHPTKLDRVAALHMVYDRGNFRTFVSKQTELLEWLVRNYSLIALGAALFLEFVYLLLTLGNSTKQSVPDFGSRPLVEKVTHSSEMNVPVLARKSSPLDSLPIPGSLGKEEERMEEVVSAPAQVLTAAPIANPQVASVVTQPIESSPVAHASVPRSEPTIATIHPTAASKEEVLDAIYLG